MTFTIQGDRRLQGEYNWVDSDVGTRDAIHAEQQGFRQA
jgi:hypothetical protein